MAISRVSSAESIRTGTQDPYTFNFTISAAAKAICVAVINGSDVQLVTGITVGGVAMTLMPYSSGTGVDSAGESGRVAMWELLSGIPTGSQVISATGQGGATDDIHFVIWELTADGTIIRGGAIAIQGDQANPQITVFSFGRMKITLCALYSGLASPQGTLAAGNTLDHTHDLGNFMSQTCYETTPDNANHTIGWSTLSSDDVAMGAAWFSEVIPLDQAGFRWRNDDGNETTATWKAAENANPASMPLDQNVRARFVVENDSASAHDNAALGLQYRKNGGSWLDVTASSTNVRSSASANLADGAATTRQLSSGTGTFTAGEFDEVDGAIASTFDLPAGNVTELEFCFQFRNADIADDDTIELRVGYPSGGGALFGAYDQTAGPVGFPVDIPKFSALSTGHHYLSGPIRSDSGDYYYGLRGDVTVEGVRDVRVWKSEDDCVTWSLVHTHQGTRPSDIMDLAAARDENNILHFFWNSIDGSDGPYFYAAFDMTDDTEEVAPEEVFVGVGASSNAQNGIVVRSDGVVVVGYSKSAGAQLETCLRRRVSGTWQSEQLLDTDFTVPHALALVLDPSTDDVHAFWHGWSSGGSGIKHRVLRASDNSLSTTDVVTTTGTSVQNPAGAGIAGNRLFVCQVDGSGNIIAWHSDSVGESPTWTSTDFAQGALDRDASSLARSYALWSSGGRAAVAWVLESDQSLHYRQWDETNDEWAATTSPGDTLTVENALMTVMVTNDGVDVTMWVSTQDVPAISNQSGVDIRGFDLGPVIADSPDVEVPLRTGFAFVDAPALAAEASSSIAAVTADQVSDAPALMAGVDATAALVTADQVQDSTPAAAQSSSSPQAITADQVSDAPAQQQSASSSPQAVTADSAADAPPYSQSASSSPVATTADAAVDSTPQAVTADSSAAIATGDQVQDAPPLEVLAEAPVNVALVTADSVVDVSSLQQNASSSPQAVAADVFVDGSPLGATSEAVVTTQLVTADQFLDSAPLAQAASSTVTATTGDQVVDGSPLAATAEAVIEVSLTTGDLVLDAPTSSTSSSGAPIALTADIYQDAPGLAIQADVVSIAETGDLYIDSASGLQVSFVLVRREEGRSRSTSSSGRMRAGNQTSAMRRSDREEGHLV